MSQFEFTSACDGKIGFLPALCLQEVFVLSKILSTKDHSRILSEIEKVTLAHPFTHHHTVP